MDTVLVAPVTPDRLADLASLFEARGGPHYCWCSAYRDPPARTATKLEKKTALCDRITAYEPVGVLAYIDGKPVGWCSVSPRESYGRLVRSKAMPTDAARSNVTWSMMCLFVPRQHRGQGLAGHLIDGAIKYAAEAGARVIEAFPFDTSGTTATHRGHSEMFRAAGFRQDGPRWYLDVQAV